MKEIFANAFRICGLFPFESKNVDYSKVLGSMQNPENISEHPKENSEIVKHLRFLEQHIEKATLEHFYLLKGADWNGKTEDSTLYSVWKNILYQSGLPFITETRVANDIIIEVEDGLNLNEAWEDIVAISQDTDDDYLTLTQECNFTNTEGMADMPTTNTKEIECQNHQTLNGDNVKGKIYVFQNIQLVPSISSVNNETCNVVHNSEQIIDKSEEVLQEFFSEESKINRSEDKTIIDEEHIKEITAEEDKVQNIETVINKGIDKDNQKKVVIEGEHNNNKCITRNNTDTNIPYKDLVKEAEETEKENIHASPDKDNQNIIPGVILPSPFKKALFWPQSMTTSNAWKEYYLKKEGEKNKQNEEKANRKRQREEKKNTSKRSIKKTRRQVKSENEEHMLEEPFNKENKGENIPSEAEFDRSKINTSDFVFVNYEDRYYPGVIKQIKGDKVLISTMTTSGLNKWKWPNETDEIWYELDEIVEKINSPKRTPEFAYNTAFKRARSTIERCNGLLKMRFRCLLKHRILHYTPTGASKIINASAILHNMCLAANIPPPQEVEEDIDFGIIHENLVEPVPLNPLRQNPDLVAGRHLQQTIVHNYFI
ncbi:hypothetical protein NQ315_014925 [Exocentrus adspersus]|uniref:DDE Tnp4 domain-containing protein n=1 Tax=Exocentrus adspersus TaxID=1586481 RepID=A0AAV8VAM1_9CUCU|nr:hypothetical protein NQ315_014925 [Exocentrus adspersus]